MRRGAGYEATLWFAPDGAGRSCRAAIAARLNQRGDRDRSEFPEMKEALAQQGFVADPGTPDALTAKIRSDIAKWRDVIAKAGIKPE